MTRLEIAARIAAGMTKDDFTPVSVIAERSLRIADELIRLEAETRPEQEPEPELPFEMVVGGVYEDREGRIEEIVSEDDDDDDNFPFNGQSGRCYTKKGTVWTNIESDFDLIKRIR